MSKNTAISLRMFQSSSKESDAYGQTDPILGSSIRRVSFFPSVVPPSANYLSNSTVPAYHYINKLDIKCSTHARGSFRNLRVARLLIL